MRNTIDVMIGGLDNGQTPSVQQHDVNSRVFTCRLWQDKDVPFVLPENAVVGAVFKWRRSNGGHEYETQIEGRSTVLVTVPAEAVKLDGIVEMQLAIHQEDSVLHGPVISFAALKSLTLGGSAESEPPLLLVALAKETQELLTELRQAKENGEFDGYTPKRGVDYWTEEDVRRISGVLDAVASEHRHLLFGFENNEMKLCVSGSNDSGGTIQLLAQNIYQPQLGRKTLRDPSAVWYKGQLYLTYTIIDWASGSSNIGFCRTRDLLHFEELPQLPTNNSVYPSIPRCYAPAFCVIDGHIYIASAAVGEGGTFTNKYGETFDESAGAGWSVINRGNMMLHEYFPESHTLKFMGLLDGVPGIDVHVCKANGQYYASGRNFKLYKADALLGPYELIWDGTEYSASGEEVWREGAYLLEKPDSTWRFFAHKPGKAYEYYDSLTDDLNDGFAAEMQTCAGDTSTAMHMTIMDTVTMEAAVRDGRAYALTNLLHNADFTQMVAQAGVSAVHGGGSATFAGDRWELVSGTVTAAANINGNGYGSVTLNGSIRQKVENMPGTWTAGVVTLAGRAEATYENGWFTITSEGGVLDSAYLYAGEHTTAQKPVARGYAAELLECQRFYVRLEAFGALSYHGYAFGTDVARIMIPLPVAMRKSDPAYKVTWTVNLTLYPGEITPSGISSVTVIGNYCAMALSASGLTSDTPLMAKGNATIELNCDLT